MLRIIGEVHPRHVFAENVKRAPIERAASDLRQLGFACRFGRLSASDVGAPHGRDRWWLRGDANGDGESVGAEHGQVARLRSAPSRVWGVESRRHVRVADGLAGDMGRARAAGNGQVPLVAALAWHGLGR
jgi:DNA (cytosine-5)-methyltransferase 1